MAHEGFKWNYNWKLTRHNLELSNLKVILGGANAKIKGGSAASSLGKIFEICTSHLDGNASTS